MPLGRCPQVLFLSAAQFVRIAVDAIKNAISIAKDVFLNVHELLVALIERFPDATLWLIAIAVVLAWVF